MVEPSVFASDVYPNPNKIYTIIPIFAQNKAIDIAGKDSKEGTKVHIWERHNGLNQQFKLNVNNDFNCTIEPLHCKNRTLDVKYSQVKNGNDIHLWGKNNTKAQYFRLVKAGEDCYTFLSSLDYNYAIDVKGKKSENGTNLILYKRNHTDAQKFKLIGKNVLLSAIEYALKYSVENDMKFKTFNPNGTNFCSRCLLAGGVNPDPIWNKNSDAFINDELLINYFQGIGIGFKENIKFDEANPGDIIFTKRENNEFSFPVFFIQKLKKGFVYCGNNPNMANKGILNMQIVLGLLQTSSLFKN